MSFENNEHIISNFNHSNHNPNFLTGIINGNLNSDDCEQSENIFEESELFVAENAHQTSSEVVMCLEETLNTVCSAVDNHIVYDNGTSENVLEEFSDTKSINVFVPDYYFDSTPVQVTGSWKEFDSKKRNNYTRGCKWAPDGSCILTCSNDNVLRLFNIPEQLWDTSQWDNIVEMEAAVKICESQLVYDYCWFPLMNSNDTTTCCLVSTSKNSPAHLWDGFTGELRCTYRSYDHMDEVVSPRSLSFDAEGQRLFCGFEKCIRIFDVDRPGRQFTERRIFSNKAGQPGIISCFAFTPSNPRISVAGSYGKNIGIYSEPSGNLEFLLQGQKGGLTHLQFSPDGMYLYSGGRKDPEILCWDMRNVSTVLFCLRRSCVTNQRMYFDVSRCGRYVVSGNHNGAITTWDVQKESIISDDDSDFDILTPVNFFMAHSDCVNGVSLNPGFPLLCSCSGQRKFPDLSESEELMFSKELPDYENSLRLWWIGK